VIRIVLTLTALALATSCTREKPAPRTGSAAPDSGTAPVSGMAHGNHNPKYGGVVLMHGDMHLEVVAREDGHITIYFSDAVRRELPASVVSDLKVTIQRPGFRADQTEMKINDSGECWEGRAGYVQDRGTDLTITYKFQGELQQSDMPYFAAQTQTDLSPHR
jgi:hypothetical protein